MATVLKCKNCGTKIKSVPRSILRHEYEEIHNTEPDYADEHTSTREHECDACGHVQVETYFGTQMIVGSKK